MRCAIARWSRRDCSRRPRSCTRLYLVLSPWQPSVHRVRRPQPTARIFAWDLAHLAEQVLHPLIADVGRGQPLPSWEAAAQKLREVVGGAYPGKADDGAFWTAFAHRTYRQRDDGQIEADYDSNIALTMIDPEVTPIPDLSPLFQAIAAKPVLVVHGALSNLLSLDGVALMRGLKPDLHTVEVENVGHAP